MPVDTQLITIYCLCDDLLQAFDHTPKAQRAMSDAEVMTTALAAALLFKGNFTTARLFLKSQGYIPTMLSKSAFSERLHRLPEAFVLLFQVLAQTWKHQEGASLYLIDSFPVSVCDNIRIKRSRL